MSRQALIEVSAYPFVAAAYSLQLMSLAAGQALFLEADWCRIPHRAKHSVHAQATHSDRRGLTRMRAPERFCQA